MKNIKIAITGATGLVGSHLCEYLARKNFSIKALVHSKRNAEPLLAQWADLSIECAEVDILDSSKVGAALAGFDVVIHAAGIVDPYADPKQIEAVNVKGAQNVLDAAIANQVQQYVFISSLSVITGNANQYNTDETAPLVLCGESYADSKVEAEKLLFSADYLEKIAITVLRPGFIYGPRERAWLPQLIAALKSGRAILVDGGTKETNVIYVQNLNKAVERSLLNEKAYGQIYNLTDGEKISKKQLFNAICANLDLPPVKKNLPGWLMKPIFEIAAILIKDMPVEKKKKLARFSKAAYRLIGINQGFSIEKARRDLNYTDLIPFDTGMSQTLSYFKQPVDKLHVSPNKVKAY